MKARFVLILFVLSSHGLFAQWGSNRLAKPFQPKTNDSLTLTQKNPVDFHFSLGTEVLVSNGFASSLFWVAPEISYQVNSKLNIRAGFFYGTDLLGSPVSFPSKSEVDLAPREKPASVSLYARGEYAVNKRLQFAATLFYENGYSPLYPMSNVETIGFSTEMEYAISEKSVLNINFTFIRSAIDDNHSFYPVNSNMKQLKGDRGFGYAPSMFGRFR